MQKQLEELSKNILFFEGEYNESFEDFLQDVSRQFDAVIHFISYQTTNDDVSAAFQTARKHLNPGGIFTFDVCYGPAVLMDRPAVRIKRMMDDEIEVTRLAEPVLHPNENLVDVNYHVVCARFAIRSSKRTE